MAPPLAPAWRLTATVRAGEAGVTSTGAPPSALYCACQWRRARWMASAPAAMASLPAKGRLAVGCDADLVAFDPDETYVVQVPCYDLEDGLRALARTAGASLKAVMLAAHVKVLSQLTAQPEFSAGLVCDARPEMAGADRVYGMFINTLPFGVDRHAGTWRELVGRVFAREVQLWPHRRYPLPAIQQDAGGQRVVDVYFNYQDFRQVDTGIVDYRASIDNSQVKNHLTSDIGGLVGSGVGTFDKRSWWGKPDANLLGSSEPRTERRRGCRPRPRP